MKVSVEQLKVLWRKYNPDFLRCAYFSAFTLNRRTFHADDEIQPGDLEFFDKNGLETVEINYSESFYNLLATEFPLDFRRPYGCMDFLNVDRHLDILNNINKQSRRKRFFFIVGDVYSTDQVSGRRTILFGHNDMLDYRIWNEKKRQIGKEQMFNYRGSENGIIIFVNMKPDAETSYVERFKKNTDLVTSIVTRKKDSRVEISPDFIPSEDTISVNDPDNLLDVYIKSNARLIIIGETITEQYKRSLLQVKQYDKFVRMMVVPHIDPGEIDHFLLQVKLVYNSNRWSI
ncbi:MAG TPA: hypothetical protein PLZ78_06400 [Spirochaetota bacterium]|nr:hypothetical protein [Spirochaetota bacterium]